MKIITLDSIISASGVQSSLDRYVLGKHLESLAKEILATSKSDALVEFDFTEGDKIETPIGTITKKKNPAIYDYSGVPEHKRYNSELVGLKAKLKDVEKRAKADGTAKLVEQTYTLQLR